MFINKRFNLMVFVVVFLVVIAPCAFADKSEDPEFSFKGKNYDFRFSLSGGNINGEFSLTGDFLYAREFGDIFFAQAAGFADISGDRKEYGGSFGIGANSDSGSIYLFADSLYSRDNWWVQLRPTVKMRFSWLGLTAFYAYPITQDVIFINDTRVGAVVYYGGEVEIVPVDWARIYGSGMLISHSHYQYKVGAEVRLFKWVSLSASWNKSADKTYSRWNSYENLQIGLNLLMGARQESFSPNHSMAVTPMYPILAEKKKDEGPKKVDVTIKYQRVYYPYSEIRPDAKDRVRLHGHLRDWGYSVGYEFEKIGEDLFKIEAKDVDVNYPTGLEAYRVYVGDGLFYSLGSYDYCRAYKIWLNGHLVPAKEVHNQGTGNGEYILVKFDKNGVPHTY